MITHPLFSFSSFYCLLFLSTFLISFICFTISSPSGKYHYNIFGYSDTSYERSSTLPTPTAEPRIYPFVLYYFLFYTPFFLSLEVFSLLLIVLRWCLASRYPFPLSMDGKRNLFVLGILVSLYRAFSFLSNVFCNVHHTWGCFRGEEAGTC